MKLNKKITSKWELPEFEKFELSKKKNKYCVCIPVINEGKKIQKQLSEMSRYSNDLDIIICDGGSTDNSLNRSFLKKTKVRSLLIKKSSGKQATQLRMGFSYALNEGYEGIIQIDGNGKDGVSALKNFIHELDNGYDYVQGSRFIKGGKHKNTPLIRWIGVRLITSPILSIAAKHWYTDITNGFRAYSRKYLLDNRVQPFRNIFEVYSLNFYLCVRASQIGLKTKEIPVARIYPKGKVPTKMKGHKGQILLLWEVVLTAIGYYNPKAKN